MSELEKIGNSSNLGAAGWDDDGTMTIRFRDGREYVYSGVDRLTYQDMINSPSPGAYFARHVKGRFNFTKVGGRK